MKPRLRGECVLVRFADDALMAFDNVDDANAIVGEVAPRHRGQAAMLVAKRPMAVFPAPGSNCGHRACCRSSASASVGMDLPSTPTRRASSTSAHRDDTARAILKRMGPASTSLA